ncbi:MAG: WD40/YVTN/BNR-like repeat-containing protein [Thermoanaerobaculaceae bacterium]
MGCLTLEPNNPHTLWVGTGENNSQRSVSWDKGVYLSRDDGETWQRVGLEKSEHNGRIVEDPRNTNVVHVAAQGPLWASGGDRSLFKSTDGRKTWKRILYISENTGVNEEWLDPRNPVCHLLPASPPPLDAHQRRSGIHHLQIRGWGQDLAAY